MSSKSGLSVLVFRDGRRGGHEKTREGPEHGNQWKTNTCLKCIQIQKVNKNVSKSYISEWSWAHPEREDDARRHHNGPGARNWQKTRQMWRNKKLPDLAPINPQMSYLGLRNSWVQVPKWMFLKRLLACCLHVVRWGVRTGPHPSKSKRVWLITRAGGELQGSR
jgi:hypothetical protein